MIKSPILAPPPPPPPPPPFSSPPSPPLSHTILVVLSGSKKSKNVITWALEKFAPEGNVAFKILNIHPRITSVPTPMGNLIPISEVREDVVTAYRQEKMWQSQEVFTSFKKMFDKKKVALEVYVIESDDVATTIAEEVTKNSIERLVIGATSRGFFSRRADMCLAISALIPNFCTVYVVSKGKLSSIRPSDSDGNATIRDGSSGRTDSSSSSSCQTSGSTDGVSSARNSQPSTLSLPASLGLEVEKLRAELRHVQEMFAVAQTETFDASRKVKGHIVFHRPGHYDYRFGLFCFSIL